MERINANDFRSNLKEWMETARNEPVKVTRKTGEAFVLLNAEQFEQMQMELVSLRGVAKGLSDAIQGRTRKADVGILDGIIENVKQELSGRKRKSKRAAG